uniref:IRG-type G domain-containing protein n=1 Tax=Periophthalmus magnuspinnatus TaxID=409849 RepID=A0A3B4BIG7_9GOBI
LNSLPENIYYLSPDTEEVQEAVENGDLPLAAARAQKALDKFKNTKLAIAITGESGSGKSSLVNAIRGIDHTHDKAAPVGVVETTMEPTKYTYPNNPNIEIWDLPGIGTTKFRAEKYVKKMQFESYDFFIIVSDTRFRENDAKLALEIQKIKKNFYFIRSKIDDGLRAAERTQRNFNKDQTLQTIKDDCIKNLKKLKVECPKVFLVSSFDLHLYDFKAFYDTLKEELPEKQSKTPFSWDCKISQICLVCL